MALLERTSEARALSIRTRSTGAAHLEVGGLDNRKCSGPPEHQRFLLRHYAALWETAEDPVESRADDSVDDEAGDNYEDGDRDEDDVDDEDDEDDEDHSDIDDEQLRPPPWDPREDAERKHTEGYEYSSLSDSDESHLSHNQRPALRNTRASHSPIPPEKAHRRVNRQDDNPRPPPSPPDERQPPTPFTDPGSDDEPTLKVQPDASGGSRDVNPRSPLPFQHTRLFRIRALYPRLTIELRPFSPNSMPPYVAISHRWGEEPTSFAISCNDSSLMLKPSLVACIERASRFAAPDTWFWVDGVCIDQSNDHEKAQQVKMLWKLFGDADTVLIYLGEGDSDSEMAIAALREAALLRNRKIFPPQWSAIRRLLHRAWFSRLWTIQEAVLARDLLVVCGDDSIHWRDVEYTYGFVKPDIVNRHDNTPKSLDSPAVGAIISLRRWRAEHGEKDPQYCKQILRLMFSQSCFLPIDRVYAVLGLFPPEMMVKIDVHYNIEYRGNYGATYLQFCRALRSCLGRNNGPVLEVLRHIARRSRECPGGIPLWCPDFSRPLPEIEGRNLGFEEMDEED